MKPLRLLSVPVFCAMLASCGVHSATPPASGTLVQSSAVQPAGAVDTNGSEWPEFRRDDQRTGNNPYQTAITVSNVGTLAPKWSVPTGGIFSSSVVVNGVVYQGDRAGDLYALNLSTGAQIWKFAGGGGGFISTPYYLGGNLYVGSQIAYHPLRPAMFYSVSAATGGQNWAYTVTEGAQMSGSAMLHNGTVYVGTDAKDEDKNECDLNKQLLGLSSTTGALVSSLNLSPKGLTGADVWSSPMLDPSGNLYIATGNECTVNLKPFPNANAVIRVIPSKPTMHVKWAFQSLLGPNDDDDFGATPIFVKGMIIEPGKDGYAYALNPATGKMIWHTEIGPTIGSPATDGTRVYIPTIVNNPKCNPGSPCGNFVALNLSDGSVAWKIPVVQNNFGYSEVTAPTVSNGIVFAAFNNAIWALNAANGATLWQYPIPSSNVVFGGITVVNGGVLVGLFASPGTFYCFTPGGK